eukprot:SAG31_NODE_8751_length_1394_cov_1.816988_2_plen_47_part_01
MSASVRRTVMAAVQKGVPLFNSGDHAGCAMVYAATAKVRSYFLVFVP